VTRRHRRARWGVGFALLLLATASCTPYYLARAGWAQAGILASRQPLWEVMVDPETDPRTAGKLRLVRDAREFALDSLNFQNAGASYTHLAHLPSDTLALVLSAAYRDRLALRTWWFPITGHVPYRAYFTERSAEQARAKLEQEGFDTDLRPTAAFSTLGWFADPLYSTLLRLDEVAIVETVLHELAHNHLFLPGQGRFNESWANFAGFAGSVAFFCRRQGGGPDSTWCRRAKDRWQDAQIVSGYLDGLETQLRTMYAREELHPEERVEHREAIYARALEDFRTRIQPELRASSYAAFGARPLNNATFLARGLYYHRLPDFQAILDGSFGGDLAAFLDWLRVEARESARGGGDPFGLLDPV
jgi:predicted aminopeptidase